MPLTEQLRAAFVAGFERGEHAMCVRLLLDNLGDELRRMFELCAGDEAERARLTGLLTERVRRDLPSLERSDLAEAWFWTCARDVTREQAVQARAANRERSRRPEPAPAASPPLLQTLAGVSPVDAAIIAFKLAGWSEQRIATTLGLDAASVARRHRNAVSRST